MEYAIALPIPPVFYPEQNPTVTQEPVRATVTV